MADAVLECKELTLKVPEKVLVENFSFSIKKGERVGLTGPNGAGKTTLLRAILGIVKPNNGEVSFGGATIGYLPQQYEYVPELTVSEFFHSLEDLYGAGFNEELKETCRLHELSDKRFSVLSGGELRRVFLGAALFQTESLLLLDEPFISLDSDSEKDMKELLMTIAARNPELSILVVSHAADFVERFCTRSLKIGN